MLFSIIIKIELVKGDKVVYPGLDSWIGYVKLLTLPYLNQLGGVSVTCKANKPFAFRSWFLSLASIAVHSRFKFMHVRMHNNTLQWYLLFVCNKLLPPPYIQQK